MQTMLGIRNLLQLNSIILSSPYYNEILSSRNIFLLSTMNFHYYLSETNSFHLINFTVWFYSAGTNIESGPLRSVNLSLAQPIA